MKRLFLLLALCGIVAIGCTEGGVDDNIDNGGNNTEQPGKGDENIEDKTTFITDSKGNVVVEAEGGEVVVTVTTNIEYSVEIPEEAQSWLSVADTRAIRTEELTFTVADNNTFEERSADVELVDSDGKSLQTINFTQLAKSNVMANNEIWYTTTDNNRIILPSTESTVFGAYFISNTYSDGKGVLTFDGEITKIGNGAFKDIRNLASITIPDSVTSIGDDAFYNCKSLTSVTIPDSVTSIGSSAFAGCTSLTSITIPDSVTSIGNYAFYGCTGKLIVNCNIPSASTSEYGAFFGSKFTQVTIGNGVTSIGDYAFWQCTSLTSVTIPDSVTSIGWHAFYGCTSLTSVTIPDSVTSIGNYAFSGCSGLKSFKGKYASSDGRCLIKDGELIGFAPCGLTQYTIPDSVTSIGDGAFSRCTSLTSVTIPDSVTSIGHYAFHNCTSLTSVTIPDSVTSIGSSVFCNCTSLTSVTIPDSVIEIGSSTFFSCDSLTSITIPHSVTSIGNRAFCDCDSLTSVTIPDSVTSIGNYAFSGCDSLTSVYITDIAAWCNISFGDYDSNPLYYAENLYLNNELVTDLIIPDGATKIGSYAFFSCDSLTSVTIPDSVTSIGNRAFCDCDSLTSVTIPDSVTSIGDEAFWYCDSLTSVTIGNGVTSIGGNAFVSCSGLKSFKGKYASSDGRCLIKDGELIGFAPCGLTQYTIPDSVTSIGDYAFSLCTSLTSVTIPDSVTSIGWHAFYGCTSLASVTIGNGVTSIGLSAFDYCTSLKEVYCKPTTPPTGDYSMFGVNASGRTIYVPSNSVSAYKSASGWSDYASAIVGYDF